MFCVYSAGFILAQRKTEGFWCFSRTFSFLFLFFRNPFLLLFEGFVRTLFSSFLFIKLILQSDFFSYNFRLLWHKPRSHYKYIQVYLKEVYLKLASVYLIRARSHHVRSMLEHIWNAFTLKHAWTYLERVHTRIIKLASPQVDRRSLVSFWDHSVVIILTQFS